MGGESWAAFKAAFALDQPPDLRLPHRAVESPAYPSDELGRFQAAIGQGDLTVTPLQVAQAYSVLTATSTPGRTHIVASWRQPHGTWTNFSRSKGQGAVRHPEADAVLQALQLGNTGIHAYAAQALAGEDLTLGWFLSVDLDRTPRLLTVIVLEGADSDTVWARGMALQELVSAYMDSIP
jgi:hypothetical protein